MNNYTAIIPARGGSKGLKDKNLSLVGGRSLIEITLQSALAVENISEVILTSDYEKILSSVPRIEKLKKHKRSADLAKDNADIRATISELCEIIETHSLILLQPTSPLRTAQNIRSAISLFETTNADSLVSICEAEHSIGHYGKFGGDGKFEHFVDPDEKNLRRQDAQKLYRYNGAIYICKVADFMENKQLTNGQVAYYEMTKLTSVDIDDHFDLMIANLIHNEQKI